MRQMYLCRSADKYVEAEASCIVSPLRIFSDASTFQILMNQGWIVRIPFMTLPLRQASRSTLNAVKILKMWRISTALYTGLLKSHALLGAFFPFCTVVGEMRWWRNRTGTVKWNNTSENPQNCCQYEVKLSPWHFEVTLECGENSVWEAHTL